MSILPFPKGVPLIVPWSWMPAADEPTSFAILASEPREFTIVNVVGHAD